MNVLSEKRVEAIRAAFDSGLSHRAAAAHCGIDHNRHRERDVKQTTWIAGWIEGLIAGWIFGLVLGCILTLAYVQSHPQS